MYSRDPRKSHFTFFQVECESKKLEDYYLSYQNKSPKHNLILSALSEEKTGLRENKLKNSKVKSM
jgi:hypothetical protein